MRCADQIGLYRAGGIIRERWSYPGRVLARLETCARRVSGVGWAWIYGWFMSMVVLSIGFADTKDQDPLPTTSEELFQPTKVWTLHLKVLPEQWSAMEPAGNSKNPFDNSMFGLGMFLFPSVVRDGDRDHDGRFTLQEFRELAQNWFMQWDQDSDGSLDSKQLRESLKALLEPSSTGEGQEEGGPQGFTLQGRQGKRNGLSSVMGFEFSYVHANLEFAGVDLGEVAVRYKGNGTFLESRGSLKRSLKIDLNKFQKGQNLAGVTTLNLHNNVADAGLMNEALSFGLFRDAGVPAPRTSYIQVYVSVDGKHDRKYLGLYSLIENVDEHFLADRGLDSGGAIFKPSDQQTMFQFKGSNWQKYQQSLDPKTKLTRVQKARVLDFCRLVSTASDDEFRARLGEFIDLDEFARFLAVTVWIADLDSLLTSGQNFYAYLNPATNQLQFFPWDKDHTFGSFGGANAKDREEHSIQVPWEGKKRWLERIFTVESFVERYRAALTQVNSEVSDSTKLKTRIEQLADAIRPAVKQESAQMLKRFELVVAGKPLPAGLFGLGGTTPTVLPFVKARAASVSDQLAGKSAGQILGKPGPGEPERPEFRPDELIETALLKALDRNKDKQLSRDEFVTGFESWFKKWDTGQAGVLPEDVVRKGLNKALPFPFPPIFGGGNKPKPSEVETSEKTPE